MIDWSASMTQTFEYYIVDPSTWTDIERIQDVKSCSINRDSETDTLGSASIDIADFLGEDYVRVYLIAIQNGIRYKYPLGTFLIQTPSTSYDGKRRSGSMDAYTPLLELKENPPPLGYSLTKGDKVLESAYRIVREQARAPVVKNDTSDTLYGDFVSSTNDTWLTYVRDLVSNAKHVLDLDEMGRILFSPKQDIASLQPVWTYDTTKDNSIIYQDISMDRDLYGIPNVVEVLYSGGHDQYYARVVNDDTNSPTSVQSRGREIIHRVTDPSFVGSPTQKQVNEYAERLLSELSSLEYTVSYTHGYCPARLGDCIRLNYPEFNLNNVKAKIISQTIKCESGCPVSEKAVFTTKLWR